MRELDNYLRENGITPKVTVCSLSEKNSKAKKVNRIIIDSVRAIFAQQKLPKSLWAEIAKAVVYLQKESPISPGTTTAYKISKLRNPILVIFVF